MTSDYLQTADDTRPVRVDNLKKADTDEFATHIMSLYAPFKTVDGVLYRCNMDNSYCFEEGEGWLRNRIERLQPKISSHDKNEIVTKVKDRSPAKREDFDNEPDWLHVKNGWVNIRTRVFRGNHIKYLSFGALPIKYNPKAAPINFARYLRTTLEPEYVRIVVKMLGYTLMKSTKYQKAFMLVGEGNNGKSVLLEVIKAYLGKQRCSSETLQRLSSRPFSAAMLYGKLANLCADIPSEKIADTGYFKMLVSGDLMTAERKNKDPFEFQNHAKLVFSTNNIPKSDDMTYAYLRRWVIIPFQRVFEGDKDDKDLRSKLTSESELSGILNLSLTGLRMLEEEGGFDEVDIEETKRRYALGASGIKDFVGVCIKFNPEAKVNECPLTEEVHRAFAEFCRERDVKNADLGKLGSELVALGAQNKKGTTKNDRRHRYVAIVLSEEGKRLLQQAVSRRPSILTISHGYKELENKDMEKTAGHTDAFMQTALIEPNRCDKCDKRLASELDLQAHRQSQHREDST